VTRARIVVLSLGAMSAGLRAQAPAPSAAQLATQKASLEDRQKMLDLLKITSLRPGRNGSNPDAPNYANYDESKANPYPKLPDPLLMKNGKKVTTPAMWGTSAGRRSWRTSIARSTDGFRQTRRR